MGASVNRVTLLGNLGNDPELRYTKGGKAVCNLSLATSYKPKEGAEQTEWHKVVAWGADAENCQKFLKKGRQIYVDGRLTTRKYTDKAGAEQRSTEVMADRVVFIGGAERSDPGAPARAANNNANNATYSADDGYDD